MMDLKPLAKPVKLYEGEVTLWFLPWNKFSQDDLCRELAAHVGADSIENMVTNDWIFAATEANLVDVEIVDSPQHVRAKAFKLYFDNRNGSVVENYELMRQIFGNDILGDYYLAREEARDKLAPADDELAGVPIEPSPGVSESDPKSGSDGSKPSKKDTKKS